MAMTATRRPRPSPTPSSRTTAVGRPVSRTASSSRRRTIRPRMAASSTTRRTADRPTPTSLGGSRTEPTSCCSSDLGSVARIAYERARRAATTRPYDYVGSYVSDLASVVDMESHPERAAQDRRRSAWRSERRVLAADRRALRHRRGGRERHGGSDVPLHVAGLGRQDPHGLLVSPTPWQS